jgi:hypothetical protein
VGVAGGFDARAGAQSQQIVKFTGQVEVLCEPALGGGIREVEVQPCEPRLIRAIGQPCHGFVGGDGCSETARRKDIGADEARPVRAIHHVAEFHVLTKGTSDRRASS